MLLKVVLVIATGLVLVEWWIHTPPGLLGKADAAAYAVCHRIASRSFFIDDQQTPLCARCTGMYLGAVLGIAYLSRFGKRSGMPSIKISIVLGMFLVAFALDGSNSYLQFFPNSPQLYQPQNWLRLLTGTGVGIGIAAVLVPVFHQTLWQTSDARSSLSGWKEFLPLLLLAVVLDLAVLSNIPWILYPLALIGAAGVPLILSMVYTILWVMISRHDNRFQHYRELWVVLLAGFLTAMIQISVFDAGRFWLTGTWNGFKL